MLTTNRLSIRLIEERDWVDVKEIWDDFNKSDNRIYDNYKDTNPDLLRPRIARWAQVSRDGEDHLFFAVCAGNEMIGFFSFNMREGGYEVGYGFKDSSQKKGYAREAFTALIEYMKELNVSCLYAGTAINNTASVNLLKSLGFSLVDTEKVSFFKDHNGEDIVFEGGNFELKLK